jgi:hypothetical protein
MFPRATEGEQLSQARSGDATVERQMVRSPESVNMNGHELPSAEKRYFIGSEKNLPVLGK